jgi:hypothetical protein
MTGKAIRWLVALAAVTVVIEGAVGQPAGTPDKVTVRIKDGSTRNYDGTLQFGPVGLQIIGADKKVLATIAPADVVKVAPGEMQGVERGVVLGLLSTEEKKTKADYEKAKLGYADLQKKAVNAPERTKRYVDYKLALMTTKVADESADDENWSALATDAVKAWSGFLADYKTGWELWPAAHTQARLQAELGKFDDAARTWNRLTKKEAELPPDLRLEVSMNEIDAQIRSKQYATAAQAAKALKESAAPGLAKDKLEIYEAAAKAAADADYAGGLKAVEAKVNAAKDAAVRGVGYSMLGELHLAANKPRDAMWAFLWVETVYNADREEAFRAMCRLTEVFRMQGDDDRVRSYREKIRRTRANF